MKENDLIKPIARLDARVVNWMADNGLTLMRIALGVIFLWFGVLKFFPGLSSAESLATRTITKLSVGYITPSVSRPVLALWECAIGMGLLTGWLMRVTLGLLFLQMIGTFLPLVFFPDETWVMAPLIPTLEGQYIIKNGVLVASGIVLGATVRGGKLVAGSRTERFTDTFQWVKKRFRRS